MSTRDEKREITKDYMQLENGPRENKKSTVPPQKQLI
jgi:hypothetical protein